MDWLEWAKSILIILSFIITTAVPFIVALKNAHKKRNGAQTDAEKAQADAEMLALCKTLMMKVEVDFKDYNAFLKARGGSAGGVKKNTVLTDLKEYAIAKGYEFNAETWSATIDSLVEFTRKVNAKL